MLVNIRVIRVDLNHSEETAPRDRKKPCLLSHSSRISARLDRRTRSIRIIQETGPIDGEPPTNVIDSLIEAERSGDASVLTFGPLPTGNEWVHELVKPLFTDEVDMAIEWPDAFHVVDWLQVCTKLSLQGVVASAKGMNFQDVLFRPRAISNGALKQIPFAECRGDSLIGLELLLQSLRNELKILPILAENRTVPNLISAENARKTAVSGLKSITQCRLHAAGIIFDHRFTVSRSSTRYSSKLSFDSSHRRAVQCVRHGSTVLDLGSADCKVALEMAKAAKKVVCVDRNHPDLPLPENIAFVADDLDKFEAILPCDRFDQVFLLDVLEHLREPETLLLRVKGLMEKQAGEIIISVPNVAFISVRLQLLFGSFHYVEKGILDRTHLRFFTARSIISSITRTGFRIKAVSYLPAPFQAILPTGIALPLSILNKVCIWFFPRIFGYQIFIRAMI